MPKYHPPKRGESYVMSIEPTGCQMCKQMAMEIKWLKHDLKEALSRWEAEYWLKRAKPGARPAGLRLTAEERACLVH